MKWFAGGSERSVKALELIQNLQNSIEGNSEQIEISQLFQRYQSELESNASSVPFILSRMNVELFEVLTKHKINLSSEQLELLKELQKLSQIRYGY
ncbi:bacteriocin immunity protein [Streptococcus parauberis]|uniref:bacteriocin immunity protein n=1 Tax=Streptococcus parauberis TaxID=1348 RepID=UPI000E3010D1|nr:bacteriocin immunity protein [Streptococcus parauberis]RFE01726.1 Enterocin A Immunity [Streptococcus parauberis]